MKTSLGLFAFVLCLPLFAAEAPSFGSYKGAVFSSATHRQPLQIQSGDFSACKQAERQLDVVKCEVQNGSLVVSGSPDTSLTVNFNKVSYLRHTRDGVSNYYLRGTSELTIGNRQVTVPVKVIATIDDKDREKVTGFIEFEDQYVKTSYQAFR
jgi:hypothetical protein